MKKGLFQVLMFCATLLITAQLSAQSFPSVAPPPSTTTYSSLPALPANYTADFSGANVTFSYNADGSITQTSSSFIPGLGLQTSTTNYPPGSTFVTQAGNSNVNYTVASVPALPSGYSYTPTGQILTPNGQTVSSFTVSSPEVPFDGGMSIMLLASGIGYGAKRLKAKKAANANA